ncbi:MAG: hypothetical protein GX249_00965 [Firmicutes bacterium]|nr:hypothetical protein [Bacillota bacterium]
MREPSKLALDWDFIIGYPLEEAEEALQEEGISYRLQFTAAPGKVSSQEDAFVIAVRGDDSDTLCLVCASTDWTVS